MHYRSSEDQRERERRSAVIGDAVQAALRQDRMTFAFQPVVSAVTGDVDYYECLLRLRDAEGDGVITAGEFIQGDRAVRLHRASIDRYILDRVLADSGALHSRCDLGFNISALISRPPTGPGCAR